MSNLLFYIHLAALGGAVVGILYADSIAMAWMRGSVEYLQKKYVRATHYTVGSALLVLMGSGVLLFWPMRDYLLHQPLFFIKMFFVSVLCVNAFAIGKIMDIASQQSFASLAAQEKTPLFISGGVSALSWAGAIIAAILLFGW